MTELLEASMVICFGISWPMSIFKSYHAHTSKGKSLVFLCFILIGYICGIAAKLMTGTITYVFVFYILNLIMVSCDCLLYFRNRHLDLLAEK